MWTSEPQSCCSGRPGRHQRDDFCELSGDFQSGRIKCCQSSAYHATFHAGVAEAVGRWVLWVHRLVAFVHLLHSLPLSFRPQWPWWPAERAFHGATFPGHASPFLLYLLPPSRPTVTRSARASCARVERCAARPASEEQLYSYLFTLPRGGPP